MYSSLSSMFSKGLFIKNRFEQKKLLNHNRILSILFLSKQLICVVLNIISFKNEDMYIKNCKILKLLTASFDSVDY